MIQSEEAVQNALKLDGSEFKARTLQVTHKRVNEPGMSYGGGRGRGRGRGGYGRGGRGRGGYGRGGRGRGGYGRGRGGYGRGRGGYQPY